MPRSRSSFHPALFGPLLLACACQARAPRPDAARDIAVAAGFDAGVVLSIEGLSLDEPFEVPIDEPLDPGGAPPARIELAEALRRALRTSPALQAALARVELALADADQARLLANPIVDLVLRFPEGGGRVNVEAGVGQELLGYLRRPRRIGAADKRVLAAVAEAVATSLTVIAEVRERYAAVQALDELMPLLDERRRTLARLTELARVRLEAGEASRLDVLALETQESELALEIAEREAERVEQRLALARALGTPSSNAGWELEPWSEIPDEVAEEGVWIRAALEHRSELAALRWELAALGDERALAGNVWLEGAEARFEAEREDGWSLGPGVAVPLPLFDDGSARRDRARASWLAARAELLRAERDVVEEVRRAHAAFRSAKANLARVTTQLIPLQRERRAQVEAVYIAGETDVTAVLLAEQDLQEAQAKQVELAQETALFLVRLERAVGGAGVAPPPASENEEERNEP